MKMNLQNYILSLETAALADSRDREKIMELLKLGLIGMKKNESQLLRCLKDLTKKTSLQITNDDLTKLDEDLQKSKRHLSEIFKNPAFISICDQHHHYSVELSKLHYLVERVSKFVSHTSRKPGAKHEGYSRRNYLVTSLYEELKFSNFNPVRFEEKSFPTEFLKFLRSERKKSSNTFNVDLKMVCLLLCYSVGKPISQKTLNAILNDKKVTQTKKEAITKEINRVKKIKVVNKRSAI